jgi:endogenous inhibitor of DNA gyrase (YacG/DUF329 family)
VLPDFDRNNFIFLKFLFQTTIDSFLACSSKTSDDVLLNLSTISCPICQLEIQTSIGNDFNSHLDKCLKQDNQVTRKQNLDSDEHFYTCPICERQIKVSDSTDDLNFHIDKCISEETKVKHSLPNSDTSDLRKNEDIDYTEVATSHSKIQSEANFFGKTKNSESSHSKSVNSKVASCDSTNSKTGKDQEPATNFFGRKEKSPPENVQGESNFFGKKQIKTFPKSNVGNESEACFSGREESEVKCPICGLVVVENLMNSHIDECLNKETIKNLRHEQSSNDQSTSKKRKTENCHKPNSKRSKVPKNKSILNYFQSKGT